MQDDELGSNKSDEGEDKGGEISSENRLSDKTAEGQEGEPSSPPVFFYVDLHLKKKNVCVMQVVIFSMCFWFQLLKPQRPEWPRRSAQMKSLLLKANKPPVNEVNGRKHTRGKDFFSLTNHKLQYLTVLEQPETEIAETKSSPEVRMRYEFSSLRFQTLYYSHSVDQRLCV